MNKDGRIYQSASAKHNVSFEQHAKHKEQLKSMEFNLYQLGYIRSRQLGIQMC